MKVYSHGAEIHSGGGHESGHIRSLPIRCPIALLRRHETQRSVLHALHVFAHLFHASVMTFCHLRVLEFLDFI